MKKSLCCLLTVFWVFCAFWCCNNQAFAGGFQIYGAAAPDAIALGAANVARDDLVSTAWYNPAAVMDFKKPEYNSGFSLVKLNWSYEPGNGQNRIKIKDKTQVVPGTNIVYPISSRYTAAFSLYTPFGLGMKWNDEDVRRLTNSGIFNDPAGSPAGTLLTRAIPAQADLQVPYLNSTIATRLSDKLSVAAGISLIKADMKLRFHSKGTLLPNTLLWDKFTKYQADGWGMGYILAAHYNAGNHWKFGVRYLSEADVKMKGTVEDHPETGLIGVKGTLKLPYTLTLGLTNSSVDRWIFSFDVTKTGWNRFDELKIVPCDSGQAKGGFAAPKNWEDSLTWRFGAEFKQDERWTFRGGYAYDNSPVGDETRNFELPGTDGHIFSLGASRKTRTFVYDVGYSYMMLEKGRAGSLSLGGVGEFTGADNHFLMFSATREF